MFVRQTLMLGEADRSGWPAGPPAGYRLREWVGAAPDDLVEAFAQARGAILDAPIGESELRPAVNQIRTTTSGNNAHMLRVNHQFGFPTTETMVAKNRAVDAPADAVPQD